jgi:hypothetical protein
MKNLIIVVLILVACFSSVFATGDCGYLTSMELVTGSDGNNYISFSTSVHPKIDCCGNYIGMLGYGTFLKLPSDPTSAALIYASFERALYNHTIHFIALSDGQFSPTNTPVPVPGNSAAYPVIIYRYTFQNP